MASSTASSSLIPPRYLPYLANTVAAISIIPLTIGFTAITNPALSIQRLKIDAKTDTRQINGVMQLAGSRMLATGISTLALWQATRKGHATYSTLGACFLPFALFLTADGWVVKELAGEGEWGHWLFVPVTLGLGLGLMGVV